MCYCFLNYKLHNLRGRRYVAGNYQGQKVVHERNWRHLLRSCFVPLKSAFVFAFTVRRRKQSRSGNHRNRFHVTILYIFVLKFLWNIANLCSECVLLFALRCRRSGRVDLEGESVQPTTFCLTKGGEDFLSTKTVGEYQAILLLFLQKDYVAI